MSKKKIVLTAGISILALLAALLWIGARHHAKMDGQMSTDTTAVVPNSSAFTAPDDVPGQLSTWIEGCLWQSGLWAMRDSFLSMDPGKRTRLRKDTIGHATVPVWHVDFSNLPVSTLDAEGGESGDEYEVELKLEGSRICSTKEIPEWIRSRTTGIGHGSCSGADDLGLAMTWFQHNFHRAPSQAEISGPANRGPTTIRVRCAKGDSLSELGLLVSLAPDTFEIENCALGPSEEIALQRLHVGRLVLRNLPDTVLDFGSTKVSREIYVEGGNVQWLSIPTGCPEGDDDCDYKQRRLRQGLSVNLTKVPLCQPDLQEELAHDGVVVSLPRCDDYPTALLQRRKAMEEEWKSLVGEGVSSHLRPDADSLDVDSIPLLATNDTLRSEAEGVSSWDQCGEGSYPEGFGIEYANYGRNWIADRRGTFFSGAAIQAKVKGRILKEGMTKAQVVELVGRPGINEGNFLGWGVHGECQESSDIVIRAHFDAKGLLDGWFLSEMGGCGDC
jgi:hypothetical protein